MITQILNAMIFSAWIVGSVVSRYIFRGTVVGLLFLITYLLSAAVDKL